MRQIDVTREFRERLLRQLKLVTAAPSQVLDAIWPLVSGEVARLNRMIALLQQQRRVR